MTIFMISFICLMEITLFWFWGEMWPICVFDMFHSKPGWMFGVVCWSVLSDICQNQMNQTDILNSLSWRTEPSFLSFFFSLCFCPFFFFFITFMFSLLSGHFEFTRSTEIVRKLRLSWTQSTEETFFKKNITQFEHSRFYCDLRTTQRSLETR